MNHNDEKVFVVIFAGGIGERMEGARIPKQFLEVGGRPIIVHTLSVFEECSEVDSIVIACVESWIGHLKELISQYRCQKVAAIIPGGETGQLSILSGLLEVEKLAGREENAIVLIHDGVRPLITREAILDCIESVRTQGSTVVVAPASETVVVNGDNSVSSIIDRSQCRLARAPQGFKLNDILLAHKKALSEGMTNFIDSISMMSHYGHKIFTVDGPTQNIKITKQEDFFALKGFMDMHEMRQLWD